MEQEASTWL